MGREGRWLLIEGDVFSRIFHLVSEDEKVTPIKILLISITVSNVTNDKNPALTSYQQRPRCRPTSAASNMGSFPENMVGGSDSTPERRQPPERTACVYFGLSKRMEEKQIEDGHPACRTCRAKTLGSLLSTPTAFYQTQGNLLFALRSLGNPESAAVWQVFLPKALSITSSEAFTVTAGQNTTHSSAAVLAGELHAVFARCAQQGATVFNRILCFLSVLLEH